MLERATGPVKQKGMKAIVALLILFPWKEFITGLVRSIATNTEWNKPTRLCLFLVSFYKEHFSRSYSVCIYSPSCSNYMKEAVQRYGAIRGGTLMMRRLLRCRPPYQGGFDPVP